jgi:hypothetical protein
LGLIFIVKFDEGEHRSFALIQANISLLLPSFHNCNLFCLKSKVGFV